MESLLVKDSPLLLPFNKDKTAFDGFVTVQVPSKETMQMATTWL